jgi:DNA-binding NarL/FixJ family response regulator
MAQEERQEWHCYEVRGGGEMIRVLLVDDRADFRRAFASLLEGQPDIEVVGMAGSLEEARRKLGGVDVALLDRGLPDGDGLGIIGELRAMNPGVRVFVISSTAEVIHPKDAIEAGADGMIDKMDAPQEIFAAIREPGGA